MARESSPSSKREKEVHVRQKRLRDMTRAERQRYDADLKLKEHFEHLKDEGLRIPDLTPNRDENGNRIGFMEMSGNVREDNFMIQHLLKEGATAIEPDDKNKRFKIVWDEKVLEARHRKIITDHEGSRKKKTRAQKGVSMQQTDLSVEHGDIADLEQYMNA